METDENLYEAGKARVTSRYVELGEERVLVADINEVESKQYMHRSPAWFALLGLVWMVLGAMGGVGMLAEQYWGRAVVTLFLAFGGGVAFFAHDRNMLTLHMNRGQDVVYRGKSEHIDRLKIRIEMAMGDDPKRDKN